VIDIAGEPKDPSPLTRHASERLAATDAEIYARLAPELIRFASSLVGPGNAEDLLGTAFLRAISSRRWRLLTNHRAYLYRVVINEAHTLHRSTSRRNERELRVAERDHVDVSAAHHDVFRALRKLPVRQRAVVHLTYWVDLSPQQVAETLHLTRRTVERELTNARSQLQELLS
jgi:RNA polymerase sigma-70 factor (ECF subfamily)